MKNFHFKYDFYRNIGFYRGRTYLICLLLSYSSINAQNPRLKFINKEVSIGEDFQVSLTYTHASEKDVFFPNSSIHFEPFEWRKTDFFPTKSIDTLSIDSVVYTLRLFNTDRFQSLALPVWVLSANDSITYLSNRDTLALNEFISNDEIKSAQLESSTSFLNLNKNIGSNVTIKVTITLIVFISLVILFFRNKIEQKLEYFRFQKIQNDFLSLFRKLMKAGEETETLEKIMTAWREQMTWIEGKPYDTLSSIEIEKIAGENVSQAIREIESSLFGGQKSDRIPLALQILFDKTKELYKLRKVAFKKQLKNIK
jgi:hypothetical protein